MKKSLTNNKAPIQIDVSLAIVNIVLLLIFFFLATGRLMNPISPDLKLSETSELPLDQLPKPILIINADGSLTLDGEDVTPELLDLALEDLPQPLILHLLINRSASANSLLSVVNLPELQKAEIRLVTLHLRDSE